MYILEIKTIRVNPQLGFGGEEGRGHSESKGLRPRL